MLCRLSTVTQTEMCFHLLMVMLIHLLVVVDLVQDGTHEEAHDCRKDESGAVVGDITPVADPELPEDHAELGEVRLRILVLELQRLATRLGNAQLLDQLLVLPAAMCVG